MTREEAKELLPIMQAYAEGKKIQVKCKTDSKALTEKWVDVVNPDLDNPRCYRIKPEPTYCPFKNGDECWQEMQQHQPFGWVKMDEECCHINRVGSDYVSVSDIDNYEFAEAYEEVTFVDGTKFGIKI